MNNKSMTSTTPARRARRRQQVPLSRRLEQLSRPRLRRRRRSLFEMLPVESLLIEIVNFLQTRDRISVLAVCKTFHRITNSDFLWKPMLQQKKQKKFQPHEKSSSSIRTFASNRQGRRITTAATESKRRIQHRDAQRENEIETLTSGLALATLRNRANHKRASNIAKLQSVFKKNQMRSGFERCLAQTVKGLKCKFVVNVNDIACPLMAIRCKNQQRSKPDFEVHHVTPAPNIESGALCFDSCSVLKLDITNIPLAGLASISTVEVMCLPELLASRNSTSVVRFNNLLWESQSGTPSSNSAISIKQSLSNCAPESRSCIIAGTLGSGNQESVEILVLNIHHADVLQALHVYNHACAIHDDLDKRYGLHGLTVSITMRSLATPWWSGAFREVFAKDQDQSESWRRSRARFSVLRAEQCTRDVTRQVLISRKATPTTSNSRRGNKVGLQQEASKLMQPAVFCRSNAFSGYVAGVAVVDCTVYDEHGGIPWSFSRLVTKQDLGVQVDGGMANSSSGSFAFSSMSTESGFVLVVQEQGVGQLVLECAAMEQDVECGTNEVLEPMLVVRECFLDLNLTFIDKWFGTRHAT